MKRRIKIPTIILIAFLITQTVAVRAQSPEGSIRYLRTQNWAKMMAGVDYISKNQRDRMMYMWGNRSEWKTYSNLYFNATESKYEDSEEEAEPGMEGWSNRKQTFFMKRDFGKNTLYDGITMLGKTYLIHDTIVTPAWKILNDLKEVAGHICMNATFADTVKKQNILVWFALDMPNSAGPERFFGLPGIILEVDINNGAMTLVADKIELKSLTKELTVPEKIKGKKINTHQYQELIAEQFKERKANEEPWFWEIRY